MTATITRRADKTPDATTILLSLTSDLAPYIPGCEELVDRPWLAFPELAR